jgi:CDP-6-deoxy-D-xylo-4-hexulose-3-dehydrase
MTDIAASLGIEQLKKLNKFNIQRRNNANLITDSIVKKFNKYFINFKYDKNYTHSYYTYAFLLKKNINFSRKDICVFLEKNGIETRPLFAGCLPDQPAFVNKKIKVFDLFSSRYVKENLFFIGVHPKINHKNIDYLSKKIESFLTKFDEK